MERFKSDETFRNKFKSFDNEEQVAAEAARQGFKFSAQELKAHCRQLNEQDLDEVSGGRRPEYSDPRAAWMG
jgi:predicted ribosomally synthesized peptide with nif11-like leader